MSGSADKTSIIAATRFGLGMGPKDLDAMGGDPKGWLLGQVDASNYKVAGDAAGGDETARRIEIAVKTRAGEKSIRRELAAPDLAKDKAAELTTRLEDARDNARRQFREIYIGDLKQMIDGGIAAKAPMQERLVRFWANHFAIGVGPYSNWIAPRLIEEAIRPNLLGSFSAMLIAVTRHPAMLYFLSNNVSVGPQSPAGLRRKKGLNENLGRELLELHTLGVDGGYTQADVIAMAKALTGWTVAENPEDANFGKFVFQANAHEPGPVKMLDGVYRESDETQATEMLHALAVHPSTAKHLSRKLAQHFIADNPSDGDIASLAHVYRETDGDLAALYAALIELDAPWDNAFSKIKQPWDYVISSLRVLDIQTNPKFVALIDRYLIAMGQPAFTAPGPQGWYDTAADWSDPSSFKERIIWASNAAHLKAEDSDPTEVATRSFGPFLKSDTLMAVQHAESREDALTLLVASPEFQRR